MSDEKTADSVDLSASQSSRRIDFEKAEVRPGIVADTWLLVVSGEAPCFNMEMSLVPLVYVDAPEYWGIEVIGTLPGGLCMTSVKPFEETLDITPVLGKRGVEVLGARLTERIDVPSR